MGKKSLSTEPAAGQSMPMTRGAITPGTACALPGAATEIIDCIMTKIPNGTRTVRVRDEGLY